jgi:acyl-CoA reductase-like NAD-dependent aldehyde dehydrogenase
MLGMREEICGPVLLTTSFETLDEVIARARSWRGALVTKAVGGYGYSGWVWETVNGRFQIKQGPKLIHLETSIPA